MDSIRRAVRIFRFLARAASHYGSSLPATIFHAVRIVRRRGFRLPEAALLDLLDPSATDSVIDAHPTRSETRKLQVLLNPEEFWPLTDKAVFYRYCQQLGIPIPMLYALLFGTGSGWRPDGAPLSGIADWSAFLRHDLPEEFIVKPSQQNGGFGLASYRRDGDKFVDASGGRVRTAAELSEQLLAAARRDTLVVQERLRSHPEIEQLGGTTALQSLRLTTLVGAAGDCRLVHGYFRLIAGDAVVDNVSDLAPGHLVAPVSLEHGVLGPAATTAAEGFGTAILPEHPSTGRAVAGFRLPHWNEACELVLAVAPRFLPLRALGWDVALTPAGPVLLETNWGWDPPNWFPGSVELLAELRAAEPLAR